MDEILNADDTILAQLLLNDCIVSDGNTLFVDLSMATLVDQLSHTLQIWVPKNQNNYYLSYISHNTGFHACFGWLKDTSVSFCVVFVFHI